MFSQILLGIAFIFFAIEHHKGREWIISNKLRNKWMPSKRIAYQKALVLPYATLGSLFIIMGIIESTNLLSLTGFLILYLTVAFIILAFTYFKVRPYFKN